MKTEVLCHNGFSYNCRLDDEEGDGKIKVEKTWAPGEIHIVEPEQNLGSFALTLGGIDITSISKEPGSIDHVECIGDALFVGTDLNKIASPFQGWYYGCRLMPNTPFWIGRISVSSKDRDSDVLYNERAPFFVININFH